MHDLLRGEVLVCVQRCTGRQWHGMPVWRRLLVAIVIEILRHHAHVLGHIVGVEPVPIARVHSHVCCVGIRYQASGGVTFGMLAERYARVSRRWGGLALVYFDVLVATTGTAVVVSWKRQDPGALVRTQALDHSCPSPSRRRC